MGLIFDLSKFNTFKNVFSVINKVIVMTIFSFFANYPFLYNIN